MATIFKRSRDKKKRPKKNEFRKKLMIPESKNSRMSRTRSQIKNRKHICKQKNIRRIFC